MDLSEVISTHCQRYFDNQPLSPNAWSPCWRDYQPGLVECSGEEHKTEDLFDYYILVESLINADSEGSASSQAGGSSNSCSSEDDFGKHLSDILSSIKFQDSVSAPSKSSSSGSSVKDINWADFETSFLAKVQSRLSELPNKDSKPDLLSQLKSDWDLKLSASSKASRLEPDSKEGELYKECKQCSGKLSNASWSTKSSPSHSNDFASAFANGKNSALPRVLDGVETRLNSSRGSDKSTNRTNLAGNVPPLTHNAFSVVGDFKNSLVSGHNSAGGFSSLGGFGSTDFKDSLANSFDYSRTGSNVDNCVGGFNDSLVNGFAYSRFGSNAVVDNKLVGSKTLNSAYGFNSLNAYSSHSVFNRVNGHTRNLGVTNYSPMKSKHVNGNNLGKKGNGQSFRNQVGNPVVYRQVLNNQLIGSQVSAGQVMGAPNLFGVPCFAPGYAGVSYGGDYFVGAHYLSPSAYVHPEFVGSPAFVNGGFFENHRYSRPGKPASKPQYHYKPFKTRPVRKKKGKQEFYAAPSLKGAEFERAAEFLRQTLLSLYRDQIMPVYFNVRGRFLEFNKDEIAPEHIIDICIRKSDVFSVVSNGSLNETYIYLVDEPEWFVGWVDRNDLTDHYSPEVWEQFFDFIKGYRDEEGNEQFPGSIYGMSKVMRQLKLPFIEGMSLGTVCHIIQLAIRLKNFLFYEVKALKPTEAVRNNEFRDIFDSLPKVDPGKSSSASKDKESPTTSKSTLSTDRTGLKRINDGV